MNLDVSPSAPYVNQLCISFSVLLFVRYSCSQNPIIRHLVDYTVYVLISYSMPKDETKHWRSLFI